MFRNFLYLDVKTLNDYLSVIDGVVVTERELKKVDVKGQSGGANIAGIGGNLNSESSQEVVEKVILTDAAKFNELFSFMEKENHIQTLNGFDKVIWDSIKRKEIIEADVVVRFPELFEKINTSGDVVSLLGNLQEATGQMLISNDDNNKINAISGITNSLAKSKVPIICEAECDNYYKFILELDRKYMHVEANELLEEVTIIGKVHKKCDENDKIEVYSLIPNLRGIVNREQRRKMEQDNSIDALIEEIEGPVMKIIPLAIFR